MTWFALFVMALLTYPITALIRRLRRREGPPPSPVRRAARWLAAVGLLTALGIPTLIMLIFAGIVEPVIVQRPLPWLALHALALATVISAALLAIGWRSTATTAGRAETTRLAVAGAVLFVPWAAYWGVLRP
jgi:hypothetical protein